MRKDWEIFLAHFNFKKARIITLPVLVLAILLTVFYVTFVNVRAQQENRIGEAVSVSPTLVEKDVTPGETVNLSIKVTNISSSAKTLYLTAADFIGDPKEGGAPQFVPSPAPGSFSTWIELAEKQVSVKPNERKEVSFKMNVPQNAEPGSHYGAIIVSEENPAPSGGAPQVAVTSQISSLIFAKVAGEVIEKGKTLSFSTTQGWYEYPPVNFEVRFENQGNVRTKPTGLIEIYNSAGVKEDVLQINKSFGGVLPNDTRKFEETWKPNKWLNIIPRMGLYRAEGVLTYGLPSQTEKLGSVNFWLIPYKFLGIVTGVILAVIIGFLIFLRLYAQAVIKGSRK